MQARYLAPILCILAVACGRSAPTEAQCGQPARNPANPRPVAVLLRHSVWFGLVDLPLLIVYDDGRVVYPATRDHGVPVSYRQARVEPATALQRFGIDSGFRTLKEHYDLRPGWSDQETVFLFTWCGDAVKKVAVRAGMVGEDRFSPQVPAPFREAYRRMVTFHPETSQPWEPDTLEVAAWAYEYAPDNPPLAWPGDWPDLDSPSTRREHDAAVGQIYLMSLPGTQRERLDRFLSQRREKQAIGINGHKWAVGYRMRFPGEARWRPLLKNLEG